VTLSPEILIENRRLLMGRLVDVVGDDRVDQHTFNPEDARFQDILATSWGHLRINRYTARPNGPNDRYCRLTEIGWSRSIEETGRLEDPEVTRRCGRLAATLKGYVEAVEYRDDQNVEFDQLVADSQLPPGWLENAITGQLLTLKFKHPVRYWEVRWIVRGSLLRVPAVFGQRA
jgi:hypothetical protein